MTLNINPQDLATFEYTAKMKFIHSKERWLDEEVNHLLEIVSEDSDIEMAQSVVLALLKCDTLTDRQFHALKENPLVKRFDISKTFTQRELLRTLESEGCTSAVIERCIQEGDGAVHKRLLEFENLPYSALHVLSINGVNKAVRNAAKQRLESSQYRQ